MERQVNRVPCVPHPAAATDGAELLAHRISCEHDEAEAREHAADDEAAILGPEDAEAVSLSLLPAAQEGEEEDELEASLRAARVSGTAGKGWRGLAGDARLVRVGWRDEWEGARAAPGSLCSCVPCAQQLACSSGRSRYRPGRE